MNITSYNSYNRKMYTQQELINYKILVYKDLMETKFKKVPVRKNNIGITFKQKKKKRKKI